MNNDGTRAAPRMRLEPCRLGNDHVVLEPLGPEHRPALVAIEQCAPDLFRLWSTRGPGDWFNRWLDEVEQSGRSGISIPFAIRLVIGGEVVGLTGYQAIEPVHGRVEIGPTFIAPEAQGGVANPASKLLLMDHAFARGAVRIEFNVDARNERSRAAVRKLGAVEEGVLRAHKVLPDGFIRDTVVHSIIAAEWPETRLHLTKRVEAAAEHAARG